MAEGSKPTVRIFPNGTGLGPYTVEGLLGIGGSALVYRARDRRLGRRVALKVFATDGAPGLNRRLLEEARSAAALNHPSIATIFEIGEAGGDCFIAMEYVDGKTLRHHLQTQPTPLPVLLDYLRQTAEAMARAHARGIIHCDLKPDNIMVTQDGLVKVLDFGLARLIASCRSSGQWETLPTDAGTAAPEATPTPRVEGTAGYMSPEQAAGVSKLDGRTDIFAFGCILYEAVTHRLPFNGSSDQSQSATPWHVAPAPLSRFCPNVPDGMQRLVDRCLEREPTRRCASMREVESSLTEIVAKLPLTDGSQWPRRTWAAAAAGAAAVSIALAISFSGYRSAEGEQKVAVIPYASSKGAEDIAYIADGIGEGLIQALTQVPGLKVIARSSSYRFRGETIDARAAARQLEVGHLVLLSVAHDGQQLKVTVDLVAADGTQIWIQTYRPAFANLAGLETGIAAELAPRVGARFSELRLARTAKTAQFKPEAYDRFLRGRYQQRLYTLESIQQAAAHYEQAVAIDPTFALAHAELANAYRYLSGSGAMDAARTRPQAEAAAHRALAADGDLAEAHAALADIRKDRWDWQGAENEYRKALALNPNLATAHQGYAIFLGVMGRHEAAIAEIQRGQALDPLGLPMMVHSAAVYYNARRFSEALQALRRAAEMDPQSPAPWAWIGMTQASAGRYPEAVQAYEKAASFGDRSTATQCYYSFALARAGRDREAATLRERIRASKEFVPPSTMAIVYVGAGRRDLAIHWLEIAYQRRDPLLQYINVEPHFDTIGSDPAFLAVVHAIGLRR